MSEISNPKIIGPGFWVYGHKLSRNIKTEQDKKIFLNYINWLKDNFPCLECRNHFREMLIKYPPENSWTVVNGGQDIGLFDWFRQRHNDVNRRLNKPIINFDQAWKMYSDENYVCAKKCDAGQVESRNSPKINIFPRNNNLFRILGL